MVFRHSFQTAVWETTKIMTVRSQLPVLRSNRNKLILQKYCRVLIEDEEVTENENIVFFKIACKIDHWCI